MKNWSLKTTMSAMFLTLFIAVSLILLAYLTDNRGLLIPVALLVVLLFLWLFVNKLIRQASEKLVIVEVDDKARKIKNMLSGVLMIAFAVGIFVFPRYFGLQYFNLIMGCWLISLLCKTYFLRPKSLVIDFGKTIRMPLTWRIEWKSLLGFKLDESNNMIFFQSTVGDKKVKISKTNDLGMLVESLHRMGVKQI